MPLVEPTDTMAVLLLVHTPPGTASLRADEAPLHTVATPEIAAGVLLTVTEVVVAHPVGNV